jgi:flagellar hook-basal body complex protein FliE
VALAPIAPISAIGHLGGTAAITAPDTVNPGSASSFATALGNGFDAVQNAQSNADNLAVQAAAGTLDDPAQLTIATTQASLMTQLATTIESKGVAAFNQIMGMQA